MKNYKRVYAEKSLRRGWLRSPNTNNTNNVYYVSPSGASNNNNANNAYAVSLDCMASCEEQQGGSKPIKGAETQKLCKEHISLPHRNSAAKINRRRRQQETSGPPDRSDPFSFDNLVKAVRECSLGVSWKNSVMRWNIDLLTLCSKLERDLKNGKYKLSKYVEMEIFTPKHRIIRSLLFRDRVVQRAMCNAGLYYDLTHGNIYDNGACQKGKGTSFAVDRMKILLGRYFRKHGHEGWVLRLDVRKFFDSIPHDRLCEMVRRKVLDPLFQKMVCDIIRSFGGDRGIGLGSQISQLLAVSYLSDFDHAIKERFRIKCYCRYSDDIVIVHEDRIKIEECYSFVREQFGILGIELNPKSTMHKLSQGIVFLHFHFVLTKTGKVVCVGDRNSASRMRRKAFKMIRKGVSKESIKTSFQSWASFAIQGGFGIKKILNLRNQIERALDNGSNC